jgi:hypothetical protein
MSTSWSVLEDATPQHCNSNPVTVSNDAAGNPYSAHTLQGYLCTFSNEWAGTAYWLFISKDQNGAPLGESRPLFLANLVILCVERMSLSLREFALLHFLMDAPALVSEAVVYLIAARMRLCPFAVGVRGTGEPHG